MEVPYRDEISRLFVFRFLWIFPLVFVVWFWMFWLGLVMFLHFFYMLFMGRRSQWLWQHMTLFFVYNTRWNAYFNLIVDERPAIFDFDVI